MISYMNLKTALTKIKELETRVKQLETKTGRDLDARKDPAWRRLEEMQEAHQVEASRRAKHALNDSFGIVPEKKTTRWLKQIDLWRKASRV